MWLFSNVIVGMDSWDNYKFIGLFMASVQRPIQLRYIHNNPIYNLSARRAT